MSVTRCSSSQVRPFHVCVLCPCVKAVCVPALATYTRAHLRRLADMRADVQQIFMKTPHEKQVMMFSATLSKDVRPTCKRFMQDVISSPQPTRATATASSRQWGRVMHASYRSHRRLR
jgi:uncharacterized protein (DUF305 family)